MYSRAEKAMENWAQRGLISDEGKAFLIATLDPFHDSQIQNLAGYPDIEVSPSVVRMVKQSMTISKPPGLAAGDWNCQIVQWPWAKLLPFRQSNSRTNNVIATDAPTQPKGGLQVLACLTSDVGQFDPNNVGVISFGALELADDILQGSNRLIGAGYEVHNTTAQIYKQGAVCNFMMHNVPKDSSVFTRDVATSPASLGQAFCGTSFRIAPRNTAEAMLIPGSNEWNAADGVLAVARFSGVDNPPFTVDYNLPVLFEIDDIPSNSAVTFPNTSQVLFPANALSAGSSAVPAWKSFPIHTSGSIFTGLSEQTSLRLNWNVIIESFPSPRDTKDLTIATPSASFDPRTLEIYSHTLGHAPVAVPVGENPLGEWFMDMVGKISNFLKPMPGIPGAIGTAGAYIYDSMKDYVTTPSGANVRTKPTKNPQQKKAIQPKEKTTKTFTQQQWQSMTPEERKAMRAQFDISVTSNPPSKNSKKKKG